MRSQVALVAGLAILSLAGDLFAQNAASWPPLDMVPQVEKSGANDIAVVIAVEDYAFLPDVPGATKNAADWEAFLSDGLGVDQVLMLTNQQAVREEMLAFAKKGASAVGEGGTLWFVFIGHGGPSKDGADGLLIGADGQQNAKSMASRGLPQKQLLAALESGAQARTVVLIDACFSGRDSSGGALARGTMPVLAVDAEPKVESSTVVMTAAKSDEFAGDLPGADRPAFSYLVLGAMRGWADDGDGEVTAGEAVTFARRKLLGIGGRQQTPQLTGSDGVVLARGVSEPAPQQSADAPAPDPAPATGGEPVVRDTTPIGPPPDGKPDSPLFVNAHGGVLLNAGNAVGWGLTAGAGGKLGELRLGALLGVANPADPDVPTSGTLDTERGNTAPITGSTGNGTNHVGVLIAGTVGYGFRHETRTRDDVLWLDAFGGVVAGRACDSSSFSYDTSKSKIVCSSTLSATAPVVGGRLGGKFSFLSASATVGYRAQGSGDLMMLFGAGVALDD